MIHDAPVNFLWDAKIKATVPRLHVEDGHLAPLRGNRGEGTIGIAKQKQGFRLVLLQCFVCRNDYLADSLGGISAAAPRNTSGSRMPRSPKNT